MPAAVGVWDAVVGQDAAVAALQVYAADPVHAYLFVQNGKLTLRDNKASNATFHNGQKLAAGEARSVKVGDTLSFGGLEFELMDAARLHEVLRARGD